MGETSPRKSVASSLAARLGISPGGLRALTFGAAVVLRLALLVFGAFVDATQRVKFSDVDYAVYTDASALVLEGRSPFERATYRYTPLLAFLLTPNVLGFPSFGKVGRAWACVALPWGHSLALSRSLSPLPTPDKR